MTVSSTGIRSHSITPNIAEDTEQKNNQADVLTTEDINYICSEYNVECDVVNGAYNHGDRDVFKMALTHRYMGHVLIVLGLQQEIYELYALAKGTVVILHIPVGNTFLSTLC